METLILKKPSGELIKEWGDWTPPKREYHWTAGRSAMELAKAWFCGNKIVVPRELTSLMQTELRLKELRLIKGVPELVTRFPEKGEGRNHDLALTGETPSEKVTICIEAKADESFGNHTVYAYLKSAEGRQAAGIRTGVPKRIKSLLAMVGQDEKISSSTAWGSVRYQLLTAICGTVLQAKIDESSLAVLVVHEFRTNLTTKKKLDKNHIELEKLIFALSSKEVKVEHGKLYGPFQINGMDLMIGKIVSNVLAGKEE